MVEGLRGRMLMEHRDAQGQSVLEVVRFWEEAWGHDIWTSICKKIDDTWAWVASGPEMQPDAAISAPEAIEDAFVIDEGASAVPATMQAPQPPPPPAARTLPQRMARLEEDAHKIHWVLAKQREMIDAMARDFSRFTVLASRGIAHLLDFARVTYVPYFETHIPYQRCRVRQRTDEASTSTAQQDDQ
nr:hypothetical protein [Tanacetum cinerariifolium]